MLYLLANNCLGITISVNNILYILFASQASLRNAGSLTSLWFFPCFFLAVCFFETIQAITRKEKQQIYLMLIGFVFAFIGLIIPRLAIGYPWSIDVAFLSLSFIILGHIGRALLETKEKKSMILLHAIVGFIIMVITCRINIHNVSINNVDLAGRYLGNAGLYFLSAVSGSYAVILISKYLLRNKTIRNGMIYLGRRTIPILVIHKPIVNRISDWIRRNNGSNVIATVLACSFSIAFSLLIYELLRRIFPLLFGEVKTKDGMIIKSN